MISKKKVTALALAGLFVTPVLAATEVKYNEIRSDDGYLTAGDKLFRQALQNSLNRTDSSKNAVKLSMYGKYDDTSNDGLTELKLSGQAYDNVNYILFADNSGQDNAFHRSSFSLEKTTLTLSKGIIFRNASNFIMRNEDGNFDENKRKQLKNESVPISVRARLPEPSSINSTRFVRAAATITRLARKTIRQSSSPSPSGRATSRMKST